MKTIYACLIVASFLAACGHYTYTHTQPPEQRAPRLELLTRNPQNSVPPSSHSDAPASVSLHLSGETIESKT